VEAALGWSPRPAAHHWAPVVEVEFPMVARVRVAAVAHALEASSGEVALNAELALAEADLGGCSKLGTCLVVEASPEQASLAVPSLVGAWKLKPRPG